MTKNSYLLSSSLAEPGRPPVRTVPPRADNAHRGSHDKLTPDLHSHCPICGHAYQAGEETILLISAAFAPGASSLRGERGLRGDAHLGHRECVLPRLLTLLASFQPATRFELASRELSAGTTAPSKAPPETPAPAAAFQS